MLQKNDGQRFHCIHVSCFSNSTTSEVNSTDHHYTDSSEESLGMHQQISSYAASYQSKEITLSLARVYFIMQTTKLQTMFSEVMLKLLTMGKICNLSH